MTTRSQRDIQNLRKTIVSHYDNQLYAPAKLLKRRHVEFLLMAFVGHLGEKHMSLHSYQPWVLFWCSHGLCLLRTPLAAEVVERARACLRELEHPEGGFGGSKGQDSSVSLTYAGVIASIYFGYGLNVELAEKSLKTTRNRGHLDMVRGGEMDCRSVYCHLAVAHMCGFVTPKLLSLVRVYLSACQNPDGGFGGEPGAESHSGYTWCALAGLALIGNLACIDSVSAITWVVARQMDIEGGCTGRPNKLVDTCYSFYVLASYIILRFALRNEKDYVCPLISEKRLADYVLKCCQKNEGGLSDHPDSRPDWYHTSYGIAALSMMIDADWQLERTSPVLNVCLPHWSLHREVLALDPQKTFAPGEEEFHEWYRGSGWLNRVFSARP